MFDANMKHLPKGRLFFAEVHAVREKSSLYQAGVRSGDIVLCTMLSIGNYNPRIKVHLLGGGSVITRHWDSHDEDKLLDTMLVYSGYVKDDKSIAGFIQDEWKEKAKDLVDRFGDNLDTLIRKF